MLTQLNKLASAQSKPTERLNRDIDRFLQYAATFPNSKSIIQPSNMVLAVHSDGSYLSESGSRSRAGGIHFFRPTKPVPTFPMNSPILVLSKILPCVLASAMETEYASLFLNAQHAVQLRNTLADLGYTQPPTTLITDNTAAAGVATRQAKQRKSRSIAMRFHWLRDRVDQKEFHIAWAPGVDNLADFYTKTLPQLDFLQKRSTYVFSPPCRFTPILMKKLRLRLT
jgi:hypothetical protein